MILQLSTPLFHQETDAVEAATLQPLSLLLSTSHKASIWFPTPIIQYYFTQLVGDAVNPPTILASPTFQGIAVIDSNPYDNTGNNWWTNQNNFYRQVRNFVVDISQVRGSATGIHWQVAQATSLTNIVFQMSTVKGSGPPRYVPWRTAQVVSSLISCSLVVSSVCGSETNSSLDVTSLSARLRPLLSSAGTGDGPSRVFTSMTAESVST